MSDSSGEANRPYREVPNGQILDTAEQYHEGFSLLVRQPSFSGVLLPALHCAYIAIELYLKSLSAREVEVPDPCLDGGGYVFARPANHSHCLTDLLARAPRDFQDSIEEHARHHPRLARFASFGDALLPLEGLFTSSRYPYEPDSDISVVPIEVIDGVLATLASGIRSVSPRIEAQQ